MHPNRSSERREVANAASTVVNVESCKSGAYVATRERHSQEHNKRASFSTIANQQLLMKRVSLTTNFSALPDCEAAIGLEKTDSL